MDTLSVVTIAKNEEEHIESFLRTVRWADEIILIDNNSADKTSLIAKRYTHKVFIHKGNNLGKLKNYALSKASGAWIMLLDVDEHVSPQLREEIKKILSKTSFFDAYAIPYQNHFLGHPLHTLEQYAKVRLFKKRYGSVDPVIVHEEMKIKGKVGKLKGKLYHYSYRSIPQVISKFTKYAELEVPLRRAQRKKATFRTLTFYPLHMFWSIFIRDKGYRDGIWGFLLALCFAYYEFMRYYFLLHERKR